MIYTPLIPIAAGLGVALYILINQIRSFKKSKQLFYQYLTPEQKEMLNRFNFIVAIGNISKRRYRIYNQFGVNVKREGRFAEGFCCAALGVPHYDNMLIKKLLIENDENSFLERSNERMNYQ